MNLEHDNLSRSHLRCFSASEQDQLECLSTEKMLVVLWVAALTLRIKAFNVLLLSNWILLAFS